MSALTSAAFRELALWAVRHGLTAAATAAVLTAAFDADLAERAIAAPVAAATCNGDATNATLHATPGVASKRPMTSAERSRKRRALKNDHEINATPPATADATDATASVACNVASVASSPLSLREYINSSREREEEVQREPVACNVASVASGLMPLPADWQPTESARKLAIEKLGEIDAANCLAKFRIHFEARPHDLRTAREWHARFRVWVLQERPPANAPHLPLMRDLAGGAAKPVNDGKIWISQLDPRWPELSRRYGPRGAFVDKRGGSRFPQDWVAALPAKQRKADYG